MASLPLSVQTTYQDLLEAHLDHVAGEFDGTPFRREVGGRGYWYVRSRVGEKQVQRYVGPDDEDTRTRMEKARSGREDQKAFERRCADLVAQLRAARLPTADRETGKLLLALARARTFRLGSVLVGTHAFRQYDALLGVRLASSATAITEDVDVASFERLSVALEDVVEPPLVQTVEALGLTPVPTIAGPSQHGKSTRWRASAGGLTLDLLTPSFEAEQQPKRLGALGVWAQGLHDLNFLIRDPVPAVVLYRSGVLVQVPRPEAFAVHKLIVSERRYGTSATKARKDREQATRLIAVLSEDRPDELLTAYQSALNEGPRWEEALGFALKRMPETAAIFRDL